MTKEEFIEKIKKINAEVPNEYFFLEYNKCVYDILEENDTYKAKLNMVRDLIMNSDKYSDSDFEGCVFQNDILDIIGDDDSDR